MVSDGRVSRWRRLCAIAIDYAAIGALGLLLAYLCYEPLVAAGEYARLAGLAIVILYFGVFNSWLGGGRSLGKRVFGLRVVRTDGRLLSPAEGALRGVIACLPLLLGNLFLPGEDPALASAIDLLGFGIPISSLYLLIFSKTGRVLHDFVASSLVEARTTSSRSAPPVWPGHWANAALICLGFALYPVLLKPAPMIKAVRQAVETVPGVRWARVQFFREWKSANFTSGVSRRLDVRATLTGLPANLPALAADLEDAVFQGHEAEIGPLPVTIHIKFGAMLGVAGLTKQPLNIAIGSFNAAHNLQVQTSVDVWRQHRAINQKAQTCADKANPDKVIKGCSFFLTLPNIEPQRRLTAHLNRAGAYIAKNEFSHAVEDYSEALKIAPDKAELLGVRGFAFSLQGDLESAFLDYDRAVKILPKDFGAVFLRGVTYFGRGQYDKAGLDFHSAAELKDDLYAIIFEFLSSARVGMPQTAGLAASVAARGDRKWPFPVIQFYLGQISSEALLSAASSNGEACEAHFYLGQWQFVNGDKADALAAMRETLATCPKTFTEYAAALAEVKREGG